MSFNNLKEWAEAALAPHASIMLAAMEHPLSDATYVAIAPVLGGEATMVEAVNSFPIETLAPASGNFMGELHQKHLTTLSAKQARAVANHLRYALRDGKSDAPSGPPYKDPEASTPTSVPAPAGSPHWDKSTRTYRCFTCNVNIVGIDALYAHREKEHGTRPPASYRAPTPGTAVATSLPTPPAGKPVLPAYVPKLNLDLSVLPDGRYAIEPTPTNGLASPWFVIKRTVKRRYYRSGRFIWGRVGRGGEYVDPGRIEVRVQVGDTKELIGEQKKGEVVYYGEREELLAEVLAAPADAMRRYGVLLGVCSYCGRSLTDDLSRMRGIGPDCWDNKHIPFLISDAKRFAAGAAFMVVGSGTVTVS